MGCDAAEHFMVNRPQTFMAYVVKRDASYNSVPITPADVATITATVMKPDGTPVTGSPFTLSPVASYVFDPPKTGDIWPGSATGFNWAHDAPGSYFPISSDDGQAEVRYDFKDSSGNVITSICFSGPVKECGDD